MSYEAKRKIRIACTLAFLGIAVYFIYEAVAVSADGDSHSVYSTLPKAVIFFVTALAALFYNFRPAIKSDFSMADAEKAFVREQDRHTSAALEEEKKVKKKLVKGYAFWQQNNFDSAISYFKSAFRKAKNKKLKAAAKVYEGICLRELGKTHEAGECFKTATEIDPTCDRAWYKLGMFYEDAGDKNAALYAYKTCVMKNPSNSYGYNLLGVFYFNEDDFEHAAQCYKRALSVNPKQPVMTANLAHTYAFLNEFSAAREFYKKALSLGYNDTNNRLLNIIDRCERTAKMAAWHQEENCDDEYSEYEYNASEEEEYY